MSLESESKDIYELIMCSGISYEQDCFSTEDDCELLNVLEKSIQSGFYNLKAIENPDFVLLMSKKVLLIEHFEFDASKRTKKGSTYPYSKAQRDREFDEYLSQNSTDSIIQSKEVTTNYTSKYYIENLKDSFLQHYRRISSYKDNILSKGFVDSLDSILTSFFIVDRTPLGCSVISSKDGMRYSFDIFQLPEFRHLMYNSPDLDYIFYASEANKSNGSRLTPNTQASCNYYEKYSIDFSYDQFTCYSSAIEQRFLYRKPILK